MDSVALDRYDVALLTALQQHARLSWVELAERASLSASAAQRRVRALQENGVIERYGTRINARAVGYEVSAFVAVSVERQNFQLAQQFRDALLDMPEVLECHLLSGSIDFMLLVVAKDLQSFGAFIQRKILSLPGVKDATSSIVLEQIKKRGPSPSGALTS